MREPAIILALRRAYRRFAGPEASLTHLPRTVLRWIVGPDFTVKLRGKPFTVNLNDAVVGASILAYRKYEDLETALMERVVKPGFTAIDLGANCGFFATLLGELVGPGGRVLAIEPQPNNARLLRKNVQQRGLDAVVTVAQAAAGSSEGTATLFLASPTNLGDYRIAADGGAAQGERVDVRVARVDDLAAGFERVDFVKMDIQGFEMQALQGMRELLARSPSVMMLAEFWPGGQRAAGNDPAAFYAILRELGFAVWEVSESRRAMVPLDEARVPGLIADLERDGALANLLCTRSGDDLSTISLA